MGSLRLEEVVLGWGEIWGLFGVFWGLHWDKTGSLRLKEVVLSWGGIWGLFGVQFGIKWAA